MPVTFHLVRHAQGLHNLSRENESIPDPALTGLGEQQCAALRADFPHHAQVARFLASPLRRALATCHLGFATASDNPILALPELKEAGDSPCDTGSEPAVLDKEFGPLVDLSQVHAGWNTPPDWVSWQAKEAQLRERAVRARRTLQRLARGLGADHHVVVVTHGAFLHFLTDDYHGVQPNHATGWQNTEFRSYSLANDDADEPALSETQESWARRNGDAPRPTRQEQVALREFFYEQLEPFLVPGSWLAGSQKEQVIRD